MSALGMMTDTATVRRKTVATSSTSGGAQVSWSNGSTGVVCSIQADTSFEAIVAMRETGKARYRGYFAYGTDIRFDDRVIPDTGLAASKILACIGPPIDHAARQEYLYVPLEEWKGGGTL